MTAEIGYRSPSGELVFYDFKGARCSGENYTGKIYDAPWLAIQKVSYSVVYEFNSLKEFRAHFDR